MFCPSCGNRVAVDAEYCSRCGDDLGGLPRIARSGPSNWWLAGAGLAALVGIVLAGWTTYRVQPFAAVNRASASVARPTPSPSPSATGSPAVAAQTPRPTPSAPPGDAPPVEPGDYRTYVNERFGFSIAYPANYLIPQRPLPTNGDGCRFLSRDGRAEMIVYGHYNALDQTLDEIAQGEQKPGRTITYRVIKGKWFVLSGYEGKKVFYQKTVQRDDVIQTFHLEADRELQAFLQPMTEKIAKSFK